MIAAPHAPAPWQRVLLAMWQQRRNLGAMWFWFAFAIALCAGAAGLLWVPKVRVGWVATTLLAFAAFGGWIWLLNNLLRQNEPHAARLVPGHVRTLRRVLLGSGALITAVAGMIGLGFGHPLPVMGATVAALLAIAWTARLPMLGMFIWIVPATSSRWSKSALFESVVDRLIAAATAQPDLAAAGLAAVLLAAVVGSAPVLLQDGTARHQRNWRNRVRMRSMLQSGRIDQTRWAAAGPFGGRLRTLSTLLYRRLLARVSTQRSGSVLGRGLIGLGPQLHWSGVLGASLTYGVLMLAIFWFVWGVALSGTPGMPRHLGSMLPIALAVWSYVVASGLAARNVLYNTRREQALLMLLPGMPRGAALNRQLAWRLIAQFVVIWGFGLGLCAGVLPVHSSQFGWVVTLAFVMLPMGSLLWCDWSRLRAPTQLAASVPVLAAIAITCGLIALQLFAELPVWPFALGGVAVTLALLAWRWRIVVAAPSAFPAGRRA